MIFKKHTPINYRPDVDGLRALAVISVILNHMGFSFFSGGYIGVDIFFVISGFLITKIITKKIHNNTFSLSTFYEKRIRRILPALYTVILVTAFFVSLIFGLGEVKSFYKTVISTLFFFSNIQFYKDIGYFNVDAVFKPLLHTWSLGVEEQFYIIFPLLLLFFYKVLKTPRKISYTLFFIFLLSMGANIWTVFYNKEMAFYFIHTRAWELMAGALLSLNIIPAFEKSWQNQVVSFVGFLMIVYGVFLYKPATLFPGYNALLPVLGTALLIHTGKGGRTYVSCVLSSRPILFIGLISYSLYLWHWPVISLNSYWALVEGAPFFDDLIIGFLIVILSITSWYFIERPFQNQKIVSTRGVLILMGSLTIIMFMVAKGAHKTTLLDEVLANPETIIYDEDFLFDKKYIDSGCNVGASRIEKGQLCAFGKTEKQEIDFAFWGDSFAETLAPAFEIAAKKQNKKFVYAIEHACPTILNVPFKGSARGSRCEVSNAFIMEQIKKHKIKNVIIHLSYNYNNIDLPAGHRCEKYNGVARFNCLLNETVETLNQLGVNVHIIGPIPGGVKPIQLRKYKKDPKDFCVPKETAYPKNPELMKGFKTLRENNKIKYYDPAQVLCFDGMCQCEHNKKPLFSDGGHISKYGALQFVGFASDVMNQIKN